MLSVFIEEKNSQEKLFEGKNIARKYYIDTIGTLL